jgi:hypothetical protein
MTAGGGAREHLQELGLQVRAGWEAIQSRYRQLVLACHPDLHPGDASCVERFRRVAAAYEALSHLRRECTADSPPGLEWMKADPRLRVLSAEELSLRLRYSSSPRVRAAAAGLLSEDPGNRGVLKAALRDCEPLVRSSALEALSRIGRPGDLLQVYRRPLKGTGVVKLLRASARIWRRAIGGESGQRG